MAEISLAGLMLCIATKTSLECANNIRTNERIYVWVNYQHEELGDTLCEIKRIGNLNQHQFIKIGDEKFTSVNVAISSLKMLMITSEWPVCSILTEAMTDIKKSHS